MANEDIGKVSALGKTLGDSAVLIAGVTVLAYVISHIYGMAYLDVFGVHEGFSGVGLSHLGMLDLMEYLIVAAFTWILYMTLTAETRSKFVLGAVVYLAVASTSQILKIAYLESMTPGDIVGVALGVAASVFLLVAHRKVRLAAVELDTTIVDAEKVLALKLEPEERAEVERGFEWMRQSRAHLKVRIWLFCAYATAFVSFPTLAKLHAIGATQQEDWRGVGTDKQQRVPVYWVGDRVVYLTFDGGCTVHVQIDGEDQARRVCPELILGVSGH